MFEIKRSLQANETKAWDENLPSRELGSRFSGKNLILVKYSASLYKIL